MRARKLVVATMAVALVAGGCTTVVRSSVSSNGTAANGQNVQRTPRSISDDGRFVIFSSDATNLVSGDTNNAVDVFRHDNRTGTTIRVSVTNAGAQIPAGSTDFSISGAGDDIAFRTAAPLEAADTNGADDVYVRTVSAGTTERVSLMASGAPIVASTDDGVLTSASLSDNGSRVVITQTVGGSGSIHMRDRALDTTKILGGGFHATAVISGDGTAFVETSLCDEASGDCPYRSQVQLTASGDHIPDVIDTQCGFRAYDITANARYVVGWRFPLTPNPCSEPTGLVRWDRTTKAFKPVPLSIGLEPMVTISNDGRFVASNGQDLRLRIIDLDTGVVQMPDADAWGAPGTGWSFGAGLSGDGRTIVFSTNSKLDPNDSNVNHDIYTRYAIQPGATSVAPSSLVRGAAHVIVTVTGTEFLSGVAATFGAGITVHSTTLVSPTSLKADVSVSPTAAVGKRDVQVQNTGAFGQSSGFCFGCVTVG